LINFVDQSQRANHYARPPASRKRQNSVPADIRNVTVLGAALRPTLTTASIKAKQEYN